jgi:ArsR family transcriptional regulator, arsenate/arsenite/antimonite-responsive transcriptional repressor
MNNKLAMTFKALGDENRLTILQLIAKGETCGCTIIEKLLVSQPTMSYHLNFLTNAQIILTKKEGVWKKHTINKKAVKELISFLQEISK